MKLTTSELLSLNAKSKDTMQEILEKFSQEELGVTIYSFLLFAIENNIIFNFTTGRFHFGSIAGKQVAGYDSKWQRPSFTFSYRVNGDRKKKFNVDLSRVAYIMHHKIIISQRLVYWDHNPINLSKENLLTLDEYRAEVEAIAMASLPARKRRQK